MAIERVREYFKQWGLENRIMEFDVSSATVELAAQALSCRPERIAKTLSFRLGDLHIKYPIITSLFDICCYCCDQP